MDEPVVLVVDDSPTVRKIVQLTLQREHIRVVTAGDGLSALTAVADEQPDLILLDIMLPRMDGYNICQVIRKNMAYRDLPIIMLSGKDGLFDKMRGKLAGSTEYITKPFDWRSWCRSSNGISNCLPCGSAPRGAPASSNKRGVASETCAPLVASKSWTRRARRLTSALANRSNRQ